MQVAGPGAALLAGRSLAMYREGQLEACLGALYLAHQLLPGARGGGAGSRVAQTCRELEGMISGSASEDPKLVRLIRSYVSEATILID